MAEKQRLAKRFADEVVENFVTPLLEGQRELFNAIQLINKAHAVMLVEQKIISAEDGKRILGSLLDLDRLGKTLSLDPYLHEIYSNIENKIIERIGAEVGGRMMTGRSRNDLYACAFRIIVRDQLIKIINEVMETMEALFIQAEKHYDTVMPGFTHTQPAQPTTLGHYFLGVADSLGEDMSRLKDAYGRTNKNPLGAAAFAGTGFPLNRELTSDLMCFSGVVENSLKSVGDYSYLLETLSVLAILMNNISRFIADLVPWTSAVYGMFEIDDSFACTSSIMPQKKNPFTAETLRATAGDMAGILMQGLTITKGVPMGFSFDLLCFGGWSLSHIEDVKKAMRVMKGLVSTMTVHKDAMERHSWDGFSTATELADRLVGSMGMSFRSAHGVLAVAVKMAIEAGRNSLTAEFINRAGKEVLGKDLGLKDDDLGVTVSQIVSSRKSAGSGAPDEVRRMVKVRREQMASEKDWRGKESGRISACQSVLDNLIREKFGL
jgi:argininosuccinate lyase